MTRVVCLCVLVAALIDLSGCSASPKSLVDKGDKLFAAGKYEEAVLDYRVAVQKDPLYGEAHYRLGLAAIKLNQPRPAYLALLRASQLLPGNNKVQEKFADVCLSLYLADPSHSQVLYDQLKRLSQEFLAANANSYEGLMLEAYLASTDNKPQEAIESFRKALRVKSSNDGVVTELAHLLIQNGEPQDGEQLATDLILEKKTSYGPAYDLMYSVDMHANRAQDAENILKAKVANNPQEADYVIELAAYFNQAHNPAAMTATLQRMLDDPKNFPQGALRVGDFYLALRDYDTAIRYYQQGIHDSRTPESTNVYEIRNVLALAREGKKTEALHMAGEFQRQNPKDSALLRTHADLLLAEGRKENASLVAREFETLLSQNPADTTLRMQLGRAYRFQGDWENARKQFLETLRQNSGLLEARYELAELALIELHPQEAVQQASTVLRTQPDDHRARVLYATGLVASGDTTTARAVLARLVKDFPQDPELQVQLGILALAERNFPQAIQILSKYRANGDVRILGTLANAYVHAKQFDEARAVLNEGLTKWPDSPALRAQLADAEALSGNYETAVAQYQRALAQDPKSIDIRLRLAEVFELEGNASRALSYYQEAHRLAPDDVAASVNLADALARAGQVDQARTLYTNVASRHPENAPALNNAAFFLADSGGDLDEALRLAQTALSKIPGQPSFYDTIGYIYLKKGMLDSAIQSFSTLARRYPASASFRYHLGLALLKKGEKAGARKELEAALSDHPSAQDTLRIRELLNGIS